MYDLLVQSVGAWLPVTTCVESGDSKALLNARARFLQERADAAGDSRVYWVESARALRI